MSGRPTVGLLGLAGSRSDPELAEHHEGFLAQVGRRLATAADIVSGIPLCSQGELAAALAELDQVGVDGVTLVPLGEVVAGGSAAELVRVKRPILLAAVQPERTLGEDWSDYDLAFNGGVQAGQMLAAECAAAGIQIAALTADWLSERFVARFTDWARAARTVRELGDDRRGADLLQRAAAVLLDERSVARISALDWNRDALLLRPSPDFATALGRLTVASLTRLAGGTLRLCVGSGESLGAAALPQIEQPHVLFAPDAGLEAFIDGWLESGPSPECVIASGNLSERWWRLAELLEIEYEEI